MLLGGDIARAGSRWLRSVGYWSNIWSSLITIIHYELLFNNLWLPGLWVHALSNKQMLLTVVRLDHLEDWTLSVAFCSFNLPCIKHHVLIDLTVAIHDLLSIQLLLGDWLRHTLPHFLEHLGLAGLSVAALPTTASLISLKLGFGWSFGCRYLERREGVIGSIVEVEVIHDILMVLIESLLLLASCSLLRLWEMFLLSGIRAFRCYSGWLRRQEHEISEVAITGVFELIDSVCNWLIRGTSFFQI